MLRIIGNKLPNTIVFCVVVRHRACPATAREVPSWQCVSSAHNLHASPLVVGSGNGAFSALSPRLGRWPQETSLWEVGVFTSFPLLHHLTLCLWCSFLGGIALPFNTGTNTISLPTKQWCLSHSLLFLSTYCTGACLVACGKSHYLWNLL